jgi:hypothetical protein
MHPSQLSKAQAAAFERIDAACRQLAESSGQTYAPPLPANLQSPPDLLLLQLSERVASALTLLVAERATD